MKKRLLCAVLLLTALITPVAAEYNDDYDFSYDEYGTEHVYKAGYRWGYDAGYGDGYSAREAESTTSDAEEYEQYEDAFDEGYAAALRSIDDQPSQLDRDEPLPEGEAMKIVSLSIVFLALLIAAWVNRCHWKSIAETNQVKINNYYEENKKLKKEIENKS